MGALDGDEWFTILHEEPVLDVEEPIFPLIIGLRDILDYRPFFEILDLLPKIRDPVLEFTYLLVMAINAGLEVVKSLFEFLLE